MDKLPLPIRSLLSRPLTTGVTFFAVAISIMLICGIERLRLGIEKSFESTVSGTDLVVGARTSSTQLMLSIIFRMTDPKNNVSWKTYQDISRNEAVLWSIPISLGDSHQSFNVVGTSPDYFRYLRYGSERKLTLADGRPLTSGDIFSAVIGSRVAASLDYDIGTAIILSHGTGVSFQDHSKIPFEIVGILDKTGTPVDNSVHITLAGMEAIHVGWENGSPPLPGAQLTPEEIVSRSLTPKTITGFLLGLKRKMEVFRFQRVLDEFQAEPLSSILPGVALSEFWHSLGFVERSLKLISFFVLIVSLTCILAIMLASLNERRREIAVLRSVGCSMIQVFIYLVMESVALAIFGMLGGVFLLFGSMLILSPLIESNFGLALPMSGLGAFDFFVFVVVLILSIFLSIVPAFLAYRRSLADGLIVRL